MCACAWGDQDRDAILTWLSCLQLKEIKNKKVRAFYEAQNARLNDWLEVDGIVMAMADDVLDSMDPDADNDGLYERVGGLQEQEGNIAALLPEEVQQQRQRAERKAKWAININVIANILLLLAKVCFHNYPTIEGKRTLTCCRSSRHSTPPPSPSSPPSSTQPSTSCAH